MYADQQDYEDRYGLDELIQLTDFDGVGEVGAAVFGRAQADGDAEIDSYLQARYSLPLDPVPTVLARIAVDLYRYYLMGAHVTEQAEKRYKDAVKFLENVAAGKVKLNPDAAGQPEPSGSVQVAATTPTFTKESLENF